MDMASCTNYQAHGHHDTEGDREFSFWDSSSDQLGVGSNGTNHNTVPQFEQGFGVYFPATMETYEGKECKYEYSPLLLHKLHCSNLSPTSRRQRILEGKRELMEMIKDMPESGFELSFQDMVEAQQALQPVQKEAYVDDTHIHSSHEDNIKKLNKKKKSKSNKRARQILRVESMDSETFLLKMFFPSSLAWMKKEKVGNGSTVSQRPPIQESTKHACKEGQVKRLLQGEEKEHRSRVGHSTSESNRNKKSSSTKIKYVDHIFPPGCWPFFSCTKRKTRQGHGDKADAFSR